MVFFLIGWDPNLFLPLADLVKLLAVDEKCLCLYGDRLKTKFVDNSVKENLFNFNKIFLRIHIVPVDIRSVDVQLDKMDCLFLIERTVGCSDFNN